MKSLFFVVLVFVSAALADAIYSTTVTVPPNLPTPYTVSSGTYAIVKYLGTVRLALRIMNHGLDVKYRYFMYLQSGYI